MNKEINQEAPVDNRRKKVGTVVSDKMDKTVVVEIVTLKTHPIYRKKYKSSKKYKAHDEENRCKVGDKVTIAECKPLSRDKRWKVVSAE
ncbi:MAG: 30S ribosomal protein S17 [Candidatus Pacebacteria bacterium]|jgi:small subunit ribosomal protein S17|nr:30S ribosomal protein S17 [Candidatus Paceibacterota bacterium]